MIGGLSAGMATGCGRAVPAATPRLGTDKAYTNDFQVSGAGYYHAPYRAWYPLPYNHFDPQTDRYFHGGNWSPQPHASITNLSSPTPDAVLAAQPAQPARPVPVPIHRGGFGGTSRHNSFLG